MDLVALMMKHMQFNKLSGFTRWVWAIIYCIPHAYNFASNHCEKAVSNRITLIKTLQSNQIQLKLSLSLSLARSLAHSFSRKIKTKIPKILFYEAFCNQFESVRKFSWEWCGRMSVVHLVQCTRKLYWNDNDGWHYYVDELNEDMC